ncbi:MAG: MobA/MobL family protein [Alphaproteobacteria bacterium]|nr:MobA/MobL family protein [Alphaproteobacteria bacterium]
MAIFHLKMSPVKRSKGQSAVASGAYICGLKVCDQRTGQTHDYTRRSGVIAISERPVGWKGSVDEFLRAMEMREGRKNSIPGRSVVLALPFPTTNKKTG